jgi:CBS domain-containing protein
MGHEQSAPVTVKPENSIAEAFRSARKERIARNTDPGKPSWVRVEAIFNGDVVKALTVLEDGSDIEKAVADVAQRLQRRYPGYTFHFDGFVVDL